MHTISSNTTWVGKKIVPAFLLLVLVMFLLLPILSKDGQRDWSPVSALALLLAVATTGAFWFVMWKKYVWTLADEVRDGGDHLVVTRGSEEERIELSQVASVSARLTSHSRRITLKLARPSRFGEEIRFAPKVPFSLKRSATREVADDLIARVDRARHGDGARL
jgi:hypothetical protein